VASGAGPHPDRVVFGIAAERDVLGRGPGGDRDALAESGVIELLAAGHVVGMPIGGAGQCGAHRQSRPAVLGAEGIEVEVEGGGGEAGTNDNGTEGGGPSHPLHKTIYHPLFAGVVELNRQLVAVHGGDVAVAEFLVKYAGADVE
jgi:hypothetical protein